MLLAPGIGPFGWPELIIIAFIILLIFGVGRLPEVGGAIGKGIREFRKASKEGLASDGEEAGTSTPGEEGGEAPQHPPASAHPQHPPQGIPPVSSTPGGALVVCDNCSYSNASGSKFCAECGTTLKTPVS